MSIDAAEYPSPETTYTNAPSVIREIGWVAHQAPNRRFGEWLGREFWLRKAAVLDRIALGDEADGIDAGASGIAEDAARRLIGVDRCDDINGDTARGPEHPGAEVDPRGYVRQAYATWAAEHLPADTNEQED
ncbi:hypothetical protein ACQEU8_11465 [Streptomyces sp. CA-250714]|uniref:hypothetical protein n=1 Tax=Streptomyces sp. CA-250714 TaxID=3240060 RepID=UPI003D91CABC